MLVNLDPGLGQGKAEKLPGNPHPARARKQEPGVKLVPVKGDLLVGDAVIHYREQVGLDILSHDLEEKKYPIRI